MWRSRQYMRIQRVRAAENRIEMQAVKWTAEGIVKGMFYHCRVLYDVKAYVSCRGYNCILQACGLFHKARWHRG